MNFLEETFVIIHIRISGAKLYFLKARTAVTLLLLLFMVFSLIQIYLLLFVEQFSIISFIQDISYLLIVMYISLLWIKSWTRANKHLNKALDIDKKVEKDE